MTNSRQALHGSSEFHAWGDSNLYLRRSGSELTLTVEHHAAPSPPMIKLELGQRGDALALEIVQSIAAPAAAPASVDERITAAITEANHPLPIGELRALCRVRNGTPHCPDCTHEGLHPPGHGDLLCAPIGNPKDRLGVLVLARPEPNTFGPLHERLILLLASLLMHLLRNRRILEDLEGEVQARTYILAQALEYTQHLRAHFEHW
ncbi:MAG: hypothetical protein B7Z66_15840, partial [Chromatiales bacterium 21-64-14]